MASSLLRSCRRLPLSSPSSSPSIAYAPFRRKRIPSTRCFTASSLSQRQDTFRHSEEQDFQAAPEIDFTAPVHQHEVPILKRIRVVPKSPSYYSAKSMFTDTYLAIENLWIQTKSLPRVEQPEQLQWLTFEEMKGRVGKETIPMTRFNAMVERLQHLSEVEPVLMPAEVKDIIQKHLKKQHIAEKKVKEDAVDEWGRSLGIGKRKTSVARAYLVMGDGQVLINNRNIAEYFNRLHDRESALWPLKITDRIHKYNVFGIVNGGGTTGQAEAMTLAVAKALLVHEPQLAQRLEDAGCLYRDPRVVERKKPGLRKARKAPQWVKR